MITVIPSNNTKKYKSSVFVLCITWFICFPLLIIHKSFSIFFWLDDRLVELYNKIDDYAGKKHIEWLNKQ